MLIENLLKGFYISRPNRFTVKFRNENNEIENAHLHDPGRLKELLIRNSEILVKYIPTYKETKRKTKYDVIAIKNNNTWILLNSSYHNKLVEELLNNKEIPSFENYHVYKAEYTYGNSRLDFLLKDDNGEDLFMEVKGCTLVVNDVAKFPDAPTKRGTKHIHELTNISLDNKKSAVIILVLHNNAKKFTPNDTDYEFSEALKNAYDNNVKIYPIHIITSVNNNNTLSLTVDKVLPILFE